MFAANAFGQTGGGYEITQSVVASGGGQTTGGTFSLDGTIGQPLAGGALNSSPFSITSGFWNFSPSAPTAAMVAVSGRVRTAQGSGIRNVIVTLTGTNGALRTVQSGTFGYFKFENVEVGDTYLISVVSKRYEFSQPTQIRSVQEEIADLEFVANDQ